MENVPQDPNANNYMSGAPSKRQQSYGAIISIIIIVAVVVIGAFYTWGKRLAENAPESTSGQVTQ